MHFKEERDSPRLMLDRVKVAREKRVFISVYDTGEEKRRAINKISRKNKLPACLKDFSQNERIWYTRIFVYSNKRKSRIWEI